MGYRGFRKSERFRNRGLENGEPEKEVNPTSERRRSPSF